MLNVFFAIWFTKNLEFIAKSNYCRYGFPFWIQKKTPALQKARKNLARSDQWLLIRLNSRKGAAGHKPLEIHRFGASLRRVGDGVPGTSTHVDGVVHNVPPKLPVLEGLDLEIAGHLGGKCVTLSFLAPSIWVPIVSFWSIVSWAVFTTKPIVATLMLWWDPEIEAYSNILQSII